MALTMIPMPFNHLGVEMTNINSLGRLCLSSFFLFSFFSKWFTNGHCNASQSFTLILKNLQKMKLVIWMLRWLISTFGTCKLSHNFVYSSQMLYNVFSKWPGKILGKLKFVCSVPRIQMSTFGWPSRELKMPFFSQMRCKWFCQNFLVGSYDKDMWYTK